MSIDKENQRSGPGPWPNPILNPGDEAPEGTPGTGEDICPDCAGIGSRQGRLCATCGGSGRIVQGIGGG